MWFVGKKMPIASETFPNTYYFSMEVRHYIVIFGSIPEFTYPPTKKDRLFNYQKARLLRTLESSRKERQNSER